MPRGAPRIPGRALKARSPAVGGAPNLPSRRSAGRVVPNPAAGRLLPDPATSARAVRSVPSCSPRTSRSNGARNRPASTRRTAAATATRRRVCPESDREPGRRRAPDGRRGVIDDPTTRVGARSAPPAAPVEPPVPEDPYDAVALDTEATALVDPSSPEFPGRHRRRAGESADERPAAAYRELAAADGRKQRTGRRRRSSFWKELPLLVVVALVLTFLIQTFLAKVYVIPSGSMETTLHGCTGCNNDRVLVDKVTYRFSDPQPGDVVVFRGPDSWITASSRSRPPSNPLVAGLQQFGSLIGLAPPDEKDFVKRVIAVGGQTVQCCDQPTAR